VSADVALELRRRCDLYMRDVPLHPEDFVERHEGRRAVRAGDIIAAMRTANVSFDMKGPAGFCYRNSIEVKGLGGNNEASPVCPPCIFR
jgi:hypothetical protein